MAKKPSTLKNQPAKDYIVGVGASAGGLEAIHEMFDNMPADTNMAFVIVQHLSPDYKSLMAELLSRHTAMQVFEAENGVTVLRNCIYVIPSRKTMTVKNGKLRLHDKVKSQQPNNAIDIFLESLAADKKECAIAVILSGTGSDGTQGIGAIKKNGGVVVVQDPITAKFDGMPNSAIATGHADMILPPELIADELADYLKEGPLLKVFSESTQRDEGLLHDILELIHQVSGHDFRHYKRPTINRRLSKRMTEKNVRNLNDYLDFLRANPDEANKLAKEFLIGVTKFFRDPEAFESLRELVLPAIFAKKKQDELTKAWVVACSTGEEAYSMAILFHEYLMQHKLPDTNVKIFATDIDREALDIASRGLYPLTIDKDITKERLARYFVREGNAYKVSPALRRMVVFAQHDVLKDPPFSKLDFISCRNMLIYMSPLLQNSIQRTFHFALHAGGYLMLGPSENIGSLRDYMTEVEKKWRIYKVLDKSRLEHEPFSPLLAPLANRVAAPGTKAKNAFTHLSDIFRDTLLEEYRMAGIFIDKDFIVKQAVGRFRDFISFPEDNFNFNLLRLVHPDLSVAISMTVRKALKTNEKNVMRNVRVRDGKNERRITVVVKPYLEQHEYLQPFLFIVLTEEDVKSPVTPATNRPVTNPKRIAELEEELRDLRENLQAVVEEVESANEELQSSNEEMISANEELQSTNEELQSLNEELHTVNAEHQLKIKELIELNDDLNNYFRNSDIGQLMIDKTLIIRKFSPVITTQINIIPSDIGRSITDLSNNFANLDFINEVKGVIRSGVPVQKEVRLNNGQVYLMKINPFVRQDKTSDGVVVSFIDIGEVKRLGNILEGVFNSSVSGIMALKAVRDKDQKIIDLQWLAANSAVDKIIGQSTGYLIGKKYRQEFADSKTGLYERYVRVIETGESDKFEFKNEEGKWYNTVVVKMEDGVVVTLTDITDQKRAADIIAQNFEALKTTSGKLELTNKALEQSNYDLMQFASVASHDLKEPLRKIQAFGNLLQAKAGDKLDGEGVYLQKMITASNRMQHLIDDVLTLSKLSNTDIPFEKTDLNKTIVRMLDDLEITIRERNATIKTGKLPVIEAASGQMHQLFQNLISNALKFNNSKTPVVTIGERAITKKEEKELNLNAAAYTCVTVEDNGIGFEPQYRDKIFGIFQRLHGSADYKGTGIGLAICKKIVENHQGVIRAESKPGKGSTFMIYLPLKQRRLRNQ